MELQFGLKGSIHVDVKDKREVKLEFVGSIYTVGDDYATEVPAPRAKITIYQNQLDDVLEGIGLNRSFQVNGPDSCLTGFPDKGESYKLTLNNITFVLDGKQAQKLGETLF